MTSNTIRRHARLGTALAALALGLGSTALATPAAAQRPAGTFKPNGRVLLSVGEGQLISLPQAVAEVWVSNPAIADVHVTNSRQINLFGKEFGDTTVIATSASGAVVYSTNVKVSQNITSVDAMLKAAMPDANISVTTVGQMAVINGTVASPEDSAQAEALVRTLLNPGINTSEASASLKILPVNRLRTATPLQVMLKVKIAEVSRSLVRQVGVNLLAATSDGGFRFGQGAAIAADGKFTLPTTGAIIGGATNLFGLDILGALELAEGDGLVTTLAEPSLTALSGETASFLAGGEYPIPIAQAEGAISVEYKSYGVGLAFTPIVLADGRISMRVRPEVSELSSEGSVRFGNTVIPALVTRRAETTVELGSGQSFMIAGLLKNSNTNNVDKVPFLGDLPILGNLFRSTRYKRAETELVIIVTPYLVRPVSGQLALPTDGYRAPNAGEMVFGGHTYKRRPLSATAVTPARGAPASPGFKL